MQIEITRLLFDFYKEFILNFDTKLLINIIT